jgi:hypothetical protein
LIVFSLERPTHGAADRAALNSAKSLGEQISDQSARSALARKKQVIDPAFVQNIQDATLATTKLSKIGRRPPPTGKLTPLCQWTEAEFNPWVNSAPSH